MRLWELVLLSSPNSNTICLVAKIPNKKSKHSWTEWLFEHSAACFALVHVSWIYWVKYWMILNKIFLEKTNRQKGNASKEDNPTHPPSRVSLCRCLGHWTSSMWIVNIVYIFCITQKVECRSSRHVTCHIYTIRIQPRWTFSHFNTRFTLKVVFSQLIVSWNY